MRDEIFQKRPQPGKSGGRNSVENSKNSLLVQASRATAFESSPNVCEIFLTTAPHILSENSESRLFRRSVKCGVEAEGGLPFVEGNEGAGSLENIEGGKLRQQAAGCL